MRLLLQIFCCAVFLAFAACNVTKERNDAASTSVQETTDGQGKKNPDGEITYQDFKNMNVEEQWRALSPARRNYLRENPDLYPRFKKMIEAEPDLELD